MESRFEFEILNVLKCCFPHFFKYIYIYIYTKGPDLPGFERGAVTFQRGDTFLLAGGLNTDFEETDRVKEKNSNLNFYKAVVKRVGKNLIVSSTSSTRRPTSGARRPGR